MKNKTKNLELALENISRQELDVLVKQVDSPLFVSTLDEMLSQKKLSKSDVIRGTVLERSYAYQIMQGRKLGSKDKILQICLAMNCTHEETDRLLTLSNNPKLYARDKRDFYILFAINNNYNVMETNELLEHHGLDSF